MLSWTPAFADNIIAKTRTWEWWLSVISTGDAWNEGCKLMLIAENYQAKREVSLKRKGVNCALFGPSQLLSTDAEDRMSTLVIFEAMRGGDGDHSGPIVELYSLTRQGFRKLGEQELFEASYLRKNEQIYAVTGKVLFSLCFDCDGPESSDSEDNIFVPVRLTIGCGGICIKPTLDKKARQATLFKFTERKATASERYTTDEYYHKYIENLQKSLSRLLSK